MIWQNINESDAARAEMRRSLYDCLTGPVLGFVAEASPERLLTVSHPLEGRRRPHDLLIPRWQRQHRHGHPEISLLVEGRCAMGQGGEVFELVPGDWALHPPNVEHFEAAVGSLSSFRQMWFLFLERQVDLTISRYDAREGLQVKFRFEGQPARFAGDSVGLLQQLTADVDTGRVSAIRATLLDLVHHFVREIETAPLRRHQGIDDPLVRQALGWLEAESAAKWNARAAAGVVDCSVVTLTRRFKRAMGCSFATYLRDRRFEYAQHLLRTTSLTLGGVAYRCGFTDDAHLVRMFRGKLGCTPKQYREANRANG